MSQRKTFPNLDTCRRDEVHILVHFLSIFKDLNVSSQIACNLTPDDVITFRTKFIACSKSVQSFIKMDVSLLPEIDRERNHVQIQWDFVEEQEDNRHNSSGPVLVTPQGNWLQLFISKMNLLDNNDELLMQNTDFVLHVPQFKRIFLTSIQELNVKVC